MRDRVLAPRRPARSGTAARGCRRSMCLRRTAPPDRLRRAAATISAFTSPVFWRRVRSTNTVRCELRASKPTNGQRATSLFGDEGDRRERADDRDIEPGDVIGQRSAAARSRTRCAGTRTRTPQQASTAGDDRTTRHRRRPRRRAADRSHWSGIRATIVKTMRENSARAIGVSPRIMRLRFVVVERHGVELEPVVDQPVAELARDLGLQALDLLGLELDHFAGAQVDQMVVVRVGDLLVARAAVAEIVPLDDAGILEQLDGAVDGRDRDALVDRGAAPVELLDVGMIVGRRRARARSCGAARSCACPWRRSSASMSVSFGACHGGVSGAHVLSRPGRLISYRPCRRVQAGSNQVAAQHQRGAALPSGRG